MDVEIGEDEIFKITIEDMSKITQMAIKEFSIKAPEYLEIPYKNKFTIRGFPDDFENILSIENSSSNKWLINLLDLYPEGIFNEDVLKQYKGIPDVYFYIYALTKLMIKPKLKFTKNLERLIEQLRKEKIYPKSLSELVRIMSKIHADYKSLGGNSIVSTLPDFDLSMKKWICRSVNAYQSTDIPNEDIKPLFYLMKAFKDYCKSFSKSNSETKKWCRHVFNVCLPKHDNGIRIIPNKLLNNFDNWRTFQKNQELSYNVNLTDDVQTHKDIETNVYKGVATTVSKRESDVLKKKRSLSKKNEDYTKNDKLASIQLPNENLNHKKKPLSSKNLDSAINIHEPYIPLAVEKVINETDLAVSNILDKPSEDIEEDAYNLSKKIQSHILEDLEVSADEDETMDIESSGGNTEGQDFIFPEESLEQTQHTTPKRSHEDVDDEDEPNRLYKRQIPIGKKVIYPRPVWNNDQISELDSDSSSSSDEDGDSENVAETDDDYDPEYYEKILEKRKNKLDIYNVISVRKFLKKNQCENLRIHGKGKKILTEFMNDRFLNGDVFCRRLKSVIHSIAFNKYKEHNCSILSKYIIEDRIVFNKELVKIAKLYFSDKDIISNILRIFGLYFFK